MVLLPHVRCVCPSTPPRSERGRELPVGDERPALRARLSLLCPHQRRHHPEAPQQDRLSAAPQYDKSSLQHPSLKSKLTLNILFRRRQKNYVSPWQTLHVFTLLFFICTHKPKIHKYVHSGPIHMHQWKDIRTMGLLHSTVPCSRAPQTEEGHYCSDLWAERLKSVAFYVDCCTTPTCDSAAQSCVVMCLAGQGVDIAFSHH